MEYGENGKMVFPPFDDRGSLGGVNAASVNAQNREEKIEVSECERKTMGSSWVQMIDKIPTTKGKTEVKCRNTQKW